MKAAILLLAAMAAAALAGDVLVLTQDNFDRTINGDLVLVKFYAPWCGHCKKLAPEYEKAATALLANDPPVVLADLDATVEKDIATKYKVTSYPTLKIFRHGVETPYNGPRTADGIIKYMAGQAGPAAKPLATEEALAKFVDFKGDVSCVGYTKAGSSFEKKFLDFAQALREDFRFGIVNDEKLVAAKNEGKEGVVLYRPTEGEDKQIVLAAADAGSITSMKGWLREKSVNFAGIYKADYASRYAEVGLPRVMVWAPAVDPKNDPSGTKYFLNRLRKAGQEFKGKLVFALADRSDSVYTELGFEPVGKAGCLGVVEPSGDRYKGSCEFSIPAVKQLARDYLDGKLERYIKSEPIPATNDKDVRVIVGKTFEEEVMKTDKDVLIMFYAPWCGHCKKLHPKFDELAKKLAPQKDKIMIASIDATANEASSRKFVAKSYPTIYFVKANDKQNPIQYNGEREVDAFIRYIKMQTSHSSLKKEL